MVSISDRAVIGKVLPAETVIREAADDSSILITRVTGRQDICGIFMVARDFIQVTNSVKILTSSEPFIDSPPRLFEPFVIVKLVTYFKLDEGYDKVGVSLGFFYEF